MTDPTKAICDGCGEEGRVFVQSVQKIDGQWHKWLQCKRCWSGETERHVSAVLEAERSGVA